jgi:hypothetical protein
MPAGLATLVPSIVLATLVVSVRSVIIPSALALVMFTPIARGMVIAIFCHYRRRHRDCNRTSN